MKKLFLFFTISALFLTFAGTLKAEEKIIDFTSAMQVKKDGLVIIEEIITVNVENIKIRRGLYRDIPNSAAEPVRFISLYMDNAPHPSFTEILGNDLRINFGDENYISRGIHTYRLSYSVSNVVKDFDEYDEIYWNVTGNSWDFTVEHASFSIFLPQGADIKNDLVSVYTGKRGSKDSNAKKTGANTFETTHRLYKNEGFTVAVPFKKGIVTSYKKSTSDSFTGLNRKGIILMSAGLLFFIFFMAYFILSWLAVGRDPKDVAVTEFTPPEGISPAFMRCLWKRTTDTKMFATALVSLAMKNKIEIVEEKVIFQKTSILNLKDKTTEGLPLEEKYIIKTLFSTKDTFKISQSNWSKLSSCINFIEKGFNIEKQKYIISNKKYIIPAVIILILFQLLFIPLGSFAAAFIFINLHYSIFSLLFVGLPKNKIFKLLAFIFVNLLYSVFFLGLGQEIGIAAIVIQGCFLLSFWALLIYVNIIDNLTEKGRELLKHIKGFHRYMTIAEEHRVALSVPVDDEKIFADYLPFAFAFDMENKWMKRFEKILSQATIEQCTHNIGGRNAFVSGLIISSINSAVPRNSSGYGGSGSGGGGSSGGGSGGGGGGGR